ncbi:MAG: dTDP-glucose 4,6-dehydratase [Alphaproteobacteria bacterium]|nr:dTDP-glucose 4,6-dehydratase [Alphaproteobacteria bacterium]
MNAISQEKCRVFVTGGAGFIGSCLARYLIAESDYQVLVFDKLTYAATLTSLDPIARDPRFQFIQGDICDKDAAIKAISTFDPDFIVHLAAESHVDRSIEGPQSFIETNVVGTLVMLQAALAHWAKLPKERAALFRFHHVSTDEVFGSLGDTGNFNEETAYDPRSPYSASKAGSDHLVRAWHHTYGLPTTITNCSNNYGPYHFPEKLIPLVILRALHGEDLPVYGKGKNIRDWLYVEDHARAIRLVFEKGISGSTYTVGGKSERKNIDVVNSICSILDRIKPRDHGNSYVEQIRFVTDRPGHDHRYAIDGSKIERELGWSPRVSFEQGLEATIRWYLANESWWRPLLERGEATARRGLKSA